MLPAAGWLKDYSTELAEALLNQLAQKTLAEIVQTVEARENAERLAAFGGAIDYKVAWEQETERCRKAGLPELSPLPHPDDIILNMRDGSVRTAGPMTREEKAEWDERIERHR